MRLGSCCASAMPIVRPCAHPDCRTLTMGEYCIEHECDEAADVAEVLIGEAAAIAETVRGTGSDAGDVSPA